MDWLDIALHVLGAIALMLIGWFLDHPTTALLLNTVLWIARELIQHWPDWREIFTRKQPLLEWTAPVVTGFVIYVIV